MKTILIYSGGLDSTVLLHQLLKDKDEINCVSFNYGQKHSIEIVSAKYFTSLFNVKHKVIDISSIKDIFSNSSLASSISIPEGNYKEESMKSTVVPNRNMIMLSIATAIAVNQKFDRIAYACHSGDHTIYPDCRPEFVSRMNDLIQIADWHPVTLYCPFVHLTKGEILQLVRNENIELKKTWSCYNGRQTHCGKCGACNERKEAFKFAKIVDNTQYEF